MSALAIEEKKVLFLTFLGININHGDTVVSVVDKFAGEILSLLLNNLFHSGILLTFPT